MHQKNIEDLREEAQRQLQLLKSLLEEGEKKGLIDDPVENHKNRATFDTASLREAIEVLDGEHHKLENLDMVLAVVGTMKAGKSTSINAIVGSEVLPNRNRPMTALPTLIRHTPSVLVPRLRFEKLGPLNDLIRRLHLVIKKVDAETHKELEGDADMRKLLAQIEQRELFVSQHEGEEGIFEFLKNLNDLVRLCFTLTRSGVEVNFPFDAYSNVEAMPVIEVEFSHLKGLQITQGRLTLLDTPGPNEDGQQHLRKMLQEQLKKASAVLAVLDYTQLKSDADAQVRVNLMEIAGTAKDRMYALVNKFDQKDRHSDDKPTVKKYVSQILMKGMMTENDVFPVSSKQGYLASRARNELERHGELNLQEAWVGDFGEECFGRRWERCIQDLKQVKTGADELWEDSGFAQPLGQVILKAYRNAALEALRSATSKLAGMAKDTEDFFNIKRGALTTDAKTLQKHIDHLQQDIDSINRAEKDIEIKLKQALLTMKQGVHVQTKIVQEKIQATLRDYLKEGKSIEAAMLLQVERAAREEQERNTQKILSTVRKVAKKAVGIEGVGRASATGNHRIETAEKNSIVIFSEREEANDFRGSIEESIRHLFEVTEGEFQSIINNGIVGFNRDLDWQRRGALEVIKNSAQKNLEVFDIEIRLPKLKPIALDTSVAGILKNAVEEKSREVTRQRRQKGMWGTVCGWFGTDDWGWEDYQSEEDYYEVDLDKIFRSSNQGLKVLFDSAQFSLDQEIYPQLQIGADEFFKIFREKIEHIRGDLMSGIEKHRLDESEKREILEYSTRLAIEASDLGKDCQTLDEKAEDLFRQEGEVVT